MPTTMPTTKQTVGIDIGGSSVKAAIAVGRAWALGASARYTQPGADAVEAAVREAVGAAIRAAAQLAPEPAQEPAPASAPDMAALATAGVGLCCPGLADPQSLVVERAVNMPALQGVRLRELLARALGRVPDAVTLATDAHAAAIDINAEERLAGRLLAISLGTGVGASVLDDGAPLRVSGATPGHLGHIDVSWGEPREARRGPDGALGTLEAYCGLAAWVSLARQRGLPIDQAIGTAGPADEPARALVRALRIAHAIYRPHHIRLLGGVGVRLAPLVPALRSAVAEGLTTLARNGWMLGVGRDDHHAARGAARLAADAAH